MISMYWLLTFIPVWFIHAALGVSVVALMVCFFITKIPVINQYKLPIKILATIILLVSVYLEGGLAYKESVAIAVAKLETKLAKAEAKANKVNIVVVEKLVKEKEIINKKGKTITEYVDREISVYNNVCLLPVEVIRAHNAAATMDPSKLEDEPK